MSDFADSIRGWGCDDDEAQEEYERLYAGWQQMKQERDEARAIVIDVCSRLWKASGSHQWLEYLSRLLNEHEWLRWKDVDLQ